MHTHIANDYNGLFQINIKYVFHSLTLITTKIKFVICRMKFEDIGIGFSYADMYRKCFNLLKLFSHACYDDKSIEVVTLNIWSFLYNVL